MMMNVEKNDNKEINRLSLLIIVVVVLVLIIAGSAYYIYYQKKQMTDLVETFDLEKELLADEFNELSIQYEGYRFSVNNDSLVALLSTEQAKVQRLMEELKTIKATNARRINELKKELETLRKIMRNYVIQIDSLNQANEQLTKEKNQAVQRYRQASNTAAELTKELEKQTERVTLASRLDATAITVTPLNARGKEAKRIKQMEQFAVNFRIVRNITAPVGEKTIYVRLKKPDDDILVKSRANLFVFEGKEISYSMKRVIEYDGEEAPVTMYWDIEEFLSPGVYRVDIFADGNLIGQKNFELDK
jgi:3-methyladenine DNA glycosylase Tag